jgi:hypothetical protein
MFPVIVLCKIKFTLHGHDSSMFGQCFDNPLPLPTLVKVVMLSEGSVKHNQKRVLWPPREEVSPRCPVTYDPTHPKTPCFTVQRLPLSLLEVNEEVGRMREFLVYIILVYYL